MDLDWIQHGAPDDGLDWHGPPDPRTRRAFVDPEQKLKQIWYLERAVEMSRSVARILFPGDTGWATCFLVAPALILTNHHVFGRSADTDGVQVQFNYRKRFDGSVARPVVHTCDPSVFVTSDRLDYSLVALTKPARVPYLRLRHQELAGDGDHVAIVQHPDGTFLQVAMRDNSLVHHDDDVIQYLTNTDYGSSGAPVFNDNWNVIALHSKRVKDPNVTDTTVWYRNQGIKVTAILRDPDVDRLIPR